MSLGLPPIFHLHFQQLLASGAAGQLCDISLLTPQYHDALDRVVDSLRLILSMVDRREEDKQREREREHEYQNQVREGAGVHGYSEENETVMEESMQGGDNPGHINALPSPVFKGTGSDEGSSNDDDSNESETCSLLSLRAMSGLSDATSDFTRPWDSGSE